jgi:hypothetical protein
MESDAVFALLLATDGTIRERSRGSYRILPPDPARNFGLSIWDYLVSSESESLRQRLPDSGRQYDGCLLVNLAGGQQSPITLVGRSCCWQLKNPDSILTCSLKSSN